MVGEGDGIAVLVLLNHLDVQSVVDQQRRVVAGQRIRGSYTQVVKDAQGRGQRGGLDGPVGALKALDSGVVAHGHQQHLGRLQGGHGGGGVKLAVAAAGDDAGGVAVVDVTLGPVGVHVHQAGVDALVQSAVVHALIHDDGEHLRHLSAVNIFGGCIGAVGLALDDAEGNQHGNGILVYNLVLIGEIVVARSGGGDDHHADEHDRRQSQAESPLEVSHLDFLLLNFEPEGRMTPLASHEKGGIPPTCSSKWHKRAAKSGVGRHLVDTPGMPSTKRARNRNGSGALLVDIW